MTGVVSALAETRCNELSAYLSQGFRFKREGQVELTELTVLVSYKVPLKRQDL